MPWRCSASSATSFIKLDFEPAPLLLGFVLGPMLEENLRRAMIISRGDATVFVTRPLSLALLLVSARAARRRPAPQHPRQTRGSLPGVTAVAITEILVHVDELPAAEARLRAAVELAAASKAHVSALALITEPFMRALVGRHLPEEFVREHLATLEREADERLAALSAIADAKGVKLETRRETAGLDHLPAILARQGRRADLDRGRPRHRHRPVGADRGGIHGHRAPGPGGADGMVRHACRRSARWSPGTARARRREPRATPCRCCRRRRT